MGIDLEKRNRGRTKLTRRRRPKSGNIYRKLLHQLYSFLSRRTQSKFNRVVAHRLAMSKNNTPPVSLLRVALAFQKRNAGKTATDEKIVVCVVGTITDDARMIRVPKIKVCCLKITESARRRILAVGGEVITFDQMALESPLGKRTCLLRGPLKARKCYKHFNGAPYVRKKTMKRKMEKGKFHGQVKRNKRYRKTN